MYLQTVSKFSRNRSAVFFLFIVSISGSHVFADEGCRATKTSPTGNIVAPIFPYSHPQQKLELLARSSSAKPDQAQDSGQIGFCRKCPKQPPPVDCKKLEADYIRKEQAAMELLKASAETDKEAVKEADEYWWDQVKSLGEVGAEKGALLHGLHVVETDSVKLLDNIISDILSEASHKAIETLEYWAVAGPLTADLVYQWAETARQLNEKMNSAEKMDREAEKLLKESVADFKKLLANNKQCQEQHDKLARAEKLANEAQQLVDTWYYSPSGDLYRDPTNGDMLTAAAALKRAKQIIQQNKRSGALHERPMILPVTLQITESEGTLHYIGQGARATNGPTAQELASFRQARAALIKAFNREILFYGAADKARSKRNTLILQLKSSQ